MERLWWRRFFQKIISTFFQNTNINRNFNPWIIIFSKKKRLQSSEKSISVLTNGDLRQKASAGRGEEAE